MNAWNQSDSVFERSILPHELFKIILTNTEMERISIESTNHAGLKGNHMFTMTVKKLKAFPTILLVSRFAGLPRQEMYWERRGGCLNLAVSAMMIKTKRLE